MNENIIREIENPQELFNAYTSVYTESTKDYYLSFTSKISSKGFLYPIDFVLGEREAKALEDTLHFIGDDGFYLSLTERPIGQRVCDWFIPIDAIDSYIKSSYSYRILANTIYSTKGNWGIIFSVDSFGAIGGSREFVDFFYSKVGYSAQDVINKFIHRFGLSKAKPILSYVLGSEQVADYLNH